MCISFFCRNCESSKPHTIVATLQANSLNFSKIKCLHCETEPFIVEYPLSQTVPDYWSQRTKDSNVIDNPLNCNSV